MQSFLTNSASRNQLPFQVSPESLKTVTVVAALIRILLLSMIHEPMHVSFVAIPVHARQPSEHIVEPFRTFRSMMGWRSTASTFRTSSAHTCPSRHRIPKTGCLRVPRPRFCFPANFLVFKRLFFHFPPRYVLSTSTIPENAGGISFVISVRSAVNSFKSLYLLMTQRSRMTFVECSRSNSAMIFLRTARDT